MGRRNTEKDFWAKVDKSGGPDACWPWNRAIHHTGYGSATHFRKNWQAHRLAFFFETGKLPAMVCHSCDNKPCCNPKHLWAGNAKENVDDKMHKGRHRGGFGETTRSSRLTEEIVRQIRKDYATGKFLQKDLIKKYGTTTIHFVVRRKTWKHVLE